MSETRTLKQLIARSSVAEIPETHRETLILAIRRCAEVARFTDDGPIADACADAIIREAGLGGEERDGD